MSKLENPKKDPRRNRAVLKDRQFDEAPDHEVDYEFESPNQWFGTHANLIPMQNAVSGARSFYGARFANQVLPLVHGEAALVQNLADGDPAGRTFDDIMGDHAGNVRSKTGGHVRKIAPDEVEVEGPDGSVEKLELFNNYPLNRKTSLHNTPILKEGDTVEPGGLVARSNFTDPKGALAMGLNARIGLVPNRGRTVDDSIVASAAFARRMSSDNLYGHELELKRGVQAGKNHYAGFFPKAFVLKQLEKLDDDGVVRPGETVHAGDPLILATRPRVISSNSSQLGLLSRHMKNSRQDASIKWDHSTPGKVIDVAKLKNGYKVNVSTVQPLSEGDKIAGRAGAKAVVSMIIPDDKMPRSADGRPFDLLLNHLSLPSRMNTQLLYEILLGKVAEKTGKPYRLPSFNGPGEKYFEFVKGELAKAGLPAEEEVFDPESGRKLERPVTTGTAHIWRLHHTSESKISARGSGAYDVNQQPSHGGGEGSQSKRVSGLEVNALNSAGAYGVLRDAATVRGQRNDAYWQALRQGQEPPEPGEPFVFEKFRRLLNGAGFVSDKKGGGAERLRFWTDRDLANQKPIEVKSGDMVDLNTLEPSAGGLFDPALTGGNKWGSIELPHRVPNPAAEPAVRRLLGLTEKDFRAVLAGELTLADAQNK